MPTRHGDYPWFKLRLALVALVLVAAGRSRARQLAGSLRWATGADLIGAADLTAGGPRRCAAAQEAAGNAQAALSDQPALTTVQRSRYCPHC